MKLETLKTLGSDHVEEMEQNESTDDEPSGMNHRNVYRINGRIPPEQKIAS
jgi:hypothetical protein